MIFPTILNFHYAMKGKIFVNILNKSKKWINNAD